MKDRLGEESRRFQWIIEQGTKLASLYGLEQISTPILESSQVFERTLGEDSDVVGKELYTFVDKGNNRLTMRPEGTAGIVRALITQNLANSLPQGYYYHGPMFRRERPQKGRLRQFEQFGVEIFGQSHPSSDVETIELASVFLANLGLKSVTLEINSLGDNVARQHYREALKSYLSKHTDKLSSDSVRSPILADYLSESSQQRFAFITETLSSLNIPFNVNPRLVRGLDYYQDTVFEFKVASPELGVQQSTVLAGGRYDGLVEQMGGPSSVSSIGWAAGLERLNLLVNEGDISRRNRPVVVLPVLDLDLIAAHSSDSSTVTIHSHAMSISSNLRRHGIQVEFMHLSGSANTKSLMKKRLSKASGLNASHAVLVGPDEIKQGVVTLKNLDRAEQRHCRIEDLVEELLSTHK
ncbi:hypothetical protein BGZ65_000380 [Modicella reniformis]|uniref:histidine--tRNA ligase n=1 Tax=Modicella reniformis TaxID=1440133 RepID=A0A9P6MMC5_9FUNG|nr:hypothetical protein BGZ65_000380 [Modicella reniformis]